MPEISRFYGLSIRMYVERGERHHLPHFHAIYQGKSAAFRIDTGELVGGYLPLRQRRLIQAWIELHRDELLANWHRLQNDEPATRIAPLV
ncbi:MAG: DUF4160 domain-containing protein [Caldilinea sp.]